MDPKFWGIGRTGRVFHLCHLKSEIAGRAGTAETVVTDLDEL